MNGRIVSIEDLSAGERGEMLQLMQAHFDGISPTGFAADLEEKSGAVLVEDETGRLRGFSTYLAYGTRAVGEALCVVCSGDTIMCADARLSSVLARTWLEAMLAAGARQADRDLYWLLICSGYRSYRFLPVFYKSFLPRAEPEASATEALRLRALAVERWGDAYDPRCGIVRLARPQILRAGISPLSSARLRDPHVAFFAAANPGYLVGDELVCLARVAPENFTSAGLRIYRQLAPRRGIAAAAVPGQSKELSA